MVRDMPKYHQKVRTFSKSAKVAMTEINGQRDIIRERETGIQDSSCARANRNRGS